MLAFSWRGTKKTKKTKDFGLFRPRLRQDSKIFVFLGFFGTSSGNGNVFHQKLAFSWRGTKKTKKPKILDSSGLAFAKTLKSLVFLVFLVPPQEMATFSTKSLHFPGGVPKKPKKPKILDSSGLAFAKTLKSLVFFGFFGTSSGNGNVFHQKLAFSWRGTKKPKKPTNQRCWTLQASPCQDSKIFGFFGFFGTSSGNGNDFHQKLAFSWRGTKKTKKPKILDSSGLAFAKTLKSLVFLVFLVPPQEMATFSTKSLHFPGGVPKKTKKNQRFWTLQASPSPRL